MKPYAPRVEVPKTINSESYGAYRDLYDVLPVATSQREPLRHLLLDHLVTTISQELAKGHTNQGYKSFLAAATLYHPTEVYQAQPMDQRLSGLARRLLLIFSPRGDEQRVLQLLTILITLEPQNRSWRQKHQQVVTWVDETQQLANGRGAKGARLIRVMEKVLTRWPSRFVLQTLRALYIERQKTLTLALSESSYRHLRQAFPALIQGKYLDPSLLVARMYLHINLPREALARLQEIAPNEGKDSELLPLLRKVVSLEVLPEDYVRLAAFFEERDAEVAQRICQFGAEQFPRAAALFACNGRLATKKDQTFGAIVNYERASELEPANISFVEELAKQYQKRLFEMIGEERLAAAEKQLVHIETFYGQSERRLKIRLKPPLSRVHYAIGHGFYNAGQTASAINAFKKSARQENTPEALLQLAIIALKGGRSDEALAYLKQTEGSSMSSPMERIFWQGRLEGIRGQAYDLLGQEKPKNLAHQRALEAWMEWLSLGLKPEARAEAYIYMAQSLFGLGMNSRAMDVIDRAIDAKPDRKETYADAIALLTTRGHLPEALDAYHRALGREEVTDYLKTYCSFWVIGLARRAGLPPDVQAVEYLKRQKGDAWYAQLAQLILERASFTQLMKDATTIGNRAELYYYWADQLVAQGKTAEAQVLWRKVLETNMMAFYEYDMAAFNLRKGVSPISVKPLDRQEPETK